VTEGRNTTTPDMRAQSFCFLAGTRLKTPSGEAEVETLDVGDQVVAISGEVEDIIWIGRKRVAGNLADGDPLAPIMISAGALGPDVPAANLLVTADHGVLVAETLCNAEALVNGGSIQRMPIEALGGEFTVYHVETRAHAIVMANGAPCETFSDAATRRAFDPVGDSVAELADWIDELPYPRVLSPRQVPARVLDVLAAAETA
jgi:hypothetical protein